MAASLLVLQEVLVVVVVVLVVGSRPAQAQAAHTWVGGLVVLHKVLLVVHRAVVVMLVVAVAVQRWRGAAPRTLQHALQGSCSSGGKAACRSCRSRSRSGAQSHQSEWKISFISLKSFIKIGFVTSDGYVPLVSLAFMQWSAESQKCVCGAASFHLRDRACLHVLLAVGLNSPLSHQLSITQTHTNSRTLRAGQTH